MECPIHLTVGNRSLSMYKRAMKVSFGLLNRRPCLVPTLRGWLLIVLALSATGFFAVKNVHSFLAVNDPVDGGALVIEGWAPDYALAEAITEFKRHHYDKLYVTGGGMEAGAPLSEYRTFAELGTAILTRIGMEQKFVEEAPAPTVGKDRTYASAVALRELLRREGKTANEINLLTVGVHARRSRLLFEKAFGPGTKVGIVAIEDHNYNPARWWKNSHGFRSVTGELIAYCYARLFFSPERE